jgi:CubicO group peptidase (beta-lactamase class C family)
MKATSLALLLIFFYLTSTCQNINTIGLMIDSFEKELDFTGVVLVAKGDSILLHKGYGYFDKKSKISTNKNTVYNIASVTKAFTAVAIVKLAEQRKLNLQDTIGKYFSNMPPPRTGITIHQLLIHHSGLPQTYAAEREDDPDKAALKVLKTEASSPPGSKFLYSNGNYTLLALIIEKVTGLKWEDHIKESILKPLEMNHTYFWADKNSTGFPEVKGKGKAIKRKRDYGFLGSTGIFSTAADLLKFQKGLKSNVLLNDSSKATLLGKYGKIKATFPNSTDYYSYGMFQTEGEFNSIWQRGNEDAWGVSIAYWLPQTNLSVIVLSDKEKLSNGEKSHMYVSACILSSLK